MKVIVSKFPRGRPPKTDWPKVLSDYRTLHGYLTQIWPLVGGRLLEAATPEEIWAILDRLCWEPKNPIAFHPTIDAFQWRVGDFWRAVHHSKFPKTQEGAQVRFIAKFLVCGSEVAIRTFDRQSSRAAKANVRAGTQHES
jgi:hypothetical protein